MSPSERREAFLRARTAAGGPPLTNADLLTIASAGQAPDPWDDAEPEFEEPGEYPLKPYAERPPDHETCVECGAFLPDERNAHRRYCSSACARRFQRRRRKRP